MTIFILKGNGILGFVREDAFSFFRFDSIESNNKDYFPSF